MEFILRPHPQNPAIPVPKTPYLGQERYDGLPFLSYPVRKGKAGAGASFDLMEYLRHEAFHPTPTREQESFLQTWLYFGLIAEFLGANLQGAHNGSSVNGPDSKEIINSLYSRLVINDGDHSYVVLDRDGLKWFLNTTRSRFPTDFEGKKNHYDHLILCLTYAHRMLSMLPRDFNHSIKFSIAAVGELFSQTVNFGIQIHKIKRDLLGMNWAIGYFNQDVKTEMKAHGWCPSDIARSEVKFKSIQTLHLIRMMDKTLPKRDHRDCTDLSCKFYQIDMGEYSVDHQEPNCRCELLQVKPTSLTTILENGDRIPLLRLTGDLKNLDAEIIESTDNTPYIAISHVWADGLGNPSANALHRCRLFHLRALTTSIATTEQQAGANPGAIPLIWLDTLCCPSEKGPGKDLAIKKIRLVYQNAQHVLVLDSGLMSYASRPLEVTEQVARIFTSSWVRRLWTLQEGALAKSLYFQFADQSLSLKALHGQLSNMGLEMRHRSFYFDVVHEFLRLASFFYFKQLNVAKADLAVLDEALQYRGVTVPTDEPLCIGTLMELDLDAIVNVQPEENRMQKVWELISSGGIPAQVIFFEEKRIDSPGWRWAPSSFLTMQEGLFRLETRLTRWRDSQLGYLTRLKPDKTPLGLRVTYPGYRISLRQYQDGRPRNPWPEMERISESHLIFRDEETGRWYQISDKKYGLEKYLTTTDSIGTGLAATDLTRTEQQDENDQPKEFPLHDFAYGDGAVIILGKWRVGILSKAQPLADGIFARLANKSDIELLGRGREILVHTKIHLIVTPLTPEHCYIYDNIEKLALRLRNSSITDDHLAVRKSYCPDTEEFRNSAEALTQNMKDVTKELVDADPRFVAAVNKYFGDGHLDHMWTLVRDWFRNDILGSKIPDEQVWIVD